VVFHSGANNAIVTDYYLKQANMNQQKKPEETYRNSPVDLVPNIIGLNTVNPLKIIGSIVAAPSLFSSDPRNSPHTLPYGWKPATLNSQGGQP
jgi:hypothetical protein